MHSSTRYVVMIIETFQKKKPELGKPDTCSNIVEKKVNSTKSAYVIQLGLCLGTYSKCRRIDSGHNYRSASNPGSFAGAGSVPSGT